MTNSDRRVRVVVGDDHPVYRDGVVRALANSGRTAVVAAVGDGQGALEAIRQHEPDVALLDYKMPGLDGIAIAHAVARDHLPTRVLLLSASTEGAVVYRAIQDGAAGYLSKESDRDDIVAAVMACARGESVLPPELVTTLATQVRQHAHSQTPLLSEREQQILRLIADGKSVPNMAKELYLAQTTIKTHIRRLYEKLGVSDRGAAVAYAMRNQMLE
jgi:two-component system, NarL family, nitrate/nitrite response regulator NarL